MVLHGKRSFSASIADGMSGSGLRKRSRHSYLHSLAGIAIGSIVDGVRSGSTYQKSRHAGKTSKGAHYNLEVRFPAEAA